MILGVNVLHFIIEYIVAWLDLVKLINDCSNRILLVDLGRSQAIWRAYMVV